jgi:hypothetical protein
MSDRGRESRPQEEKLEASIEVLHDGDKEAGENDLEAEDR